MPKTSEHIMQVERLETLHCDAGWRDYHFCYESDGTVRGGRPE